MKYIIVRESFQLNKYQIILDRWNVNITISEVLEKWSEPQRFYHNKTHLFYLLNRIESIKTTVSEIDYEKLILIALFHDIVYVPQNRDNEELSANFFISKCVVVNSYIKDVEEAILDTKNHISKNDVSKMFNDFDMSIIESDYDKLLDWEMGIWNEYKSFGKEVYKENRLKFLNSVLNKTNNKDNLLRLINWVSKNYI